MLKLFHFVVVVMVDKLDITFRLTNGNSVCHSQRVLKASSSH